MIGLNEPRETMPSKMIFLAYPLPPYSHDTIIFKINYKFFFYHKLHQLVIITDNRQREKEQNTSI